MQRPLPFRCNHCRQVKTIRVDLADIEAWQNGAFIQDALHYLSPADRELIKLAICGECWDKMFGHCDELCPDCGEELDDPNDDLCADCRSKNPPHGQNLSCFI